MSKAGLIMLTKSSALEFAPFGIRVNCVAPSFIESNILKYAGLSQFEMNQFRKRASENNPLKRLCMPEEVAKAIVFLTSDASETMTGHVMKVDGGKSLTQDGYRDWYGSERMDRRFEPSSSGLRSAWISVKQAIFHRPPRGDQGSNNWVQWKQRSNWATHSDEAHQKVKATYIPQQEENLTEFVSQEQYGGL